MTVAGTPSHDLAAILLPSDIERLTRLAAEWEARAARHWQDINYPVGLIVANPSGGVRSLDDMEISLGDFTGLLNDLAVAQADATNLRQALADYDSTVEQAAEELVERDDHDFFWKDRVADAVTVFKALRRRHREALAAVRPATTEEQP